MGQAPTDEAEVALDVLFDAELVEEALDVLLVPVVDSDEEDKLLVVVVDWGSDVMVDEI
jgi:hypothetical protein